MNLFNFILEGYYYNDDYQLEKICKDLIENDTESKESEKPKFSYLYLTFDCVNVYYDYAADYYYFEFLSHNDRTDS